MVMNKEIFKLVFKIWKEHQKYNLKITKHTTKRLLLTMAVVIWGTDDLHKVQLFHAGLQEMLTNWPKTKGTAIQKAALFINQQENNQTQEEWFLNSLDQKGMYQA